MPGLLHCVRNDGNLFIQSVIARNEAPELARASKIIQKKEMLYLPKIYNNDNYNEYFIQKFIETKVAAMNCGVLTLT